ncbi:unnamed protein product [Scytosiphon promiscuus]
MEINLPVSTVLGFMLDDSFLDLANVSKLLSAKYAPKVTQIGDDASFDSIVK